MRVCDNGECAMKVDFNYPRRTVGQAGMDLCTPCDLALTRRDWITLAQRQHPPLSGGAQNERDESTHDVTRDDVSAPRDDDVTTEAHPETSLITLRAINDIGWMVEMNLLHPTAKRERIVRGTVQPQPGKVIRIYHPKQIKIEYE